MGLLVLSSELLLQTIVDNGIIVITTLGLYILMFPLLWITVILFGNPIYTLLSPSSWVYNVRADQGAKLLCWQGSGRHIDGSP